jgi:hypothetical protein
MRIVYVAFICALLVVIGVSYYERHEARPVTTSAPGPAHGANQSAAAPSLSVRTVAWYQAHPDQIKEKLAACSNDPGTAMHDPECNNAETAKHNNDIDHFIQSAPKDAQPVAPERK